MSFKRYVEPYVLEASLHTDLLQYLMGAYPGQLPPVRRELHNIVMPVDLSSPKDMNMVSTTLFTFVKRMIPVRFGFVPTTSSPEAIAQAKVVHYLQETYGLAALIEYLEEVMSSIQKSNYVLISIPRSLPPNRKRQFQINPFSPPSPRNANLAPRRRPYLWMRY